MNTPDQNGRRGFQFSLKQLLVMIFWMSIACGAFAALVKVRMPTQQQFMLVAVCIWVVIGGSLGAAVGTVLGWARTGFIIGAVVIVPALYAWQALAAALR